MRALPFLEIPIVQAPMAGAATPELVAAVSNAGGLGSLPLGFTEPAHVAPLVARVRALTARPFALNLFVDTSAPVEPAVLQRAHDRLRPFREELGIPHPPVPAVALLDARAQVEAVLAARPAVFSFTFGVPEAAVLERCRAAGIFTIGSANTVEEAVALERAGVDAVCAQGFEAGGHHGSFGQPVEFSQIGTLALVPQVVDAVGVPVIAAGGIGDGRGVAAVLALGAAAAQVGSAFLRADEAGIPAAFRSVLATPAARRTSITTTFSGRTARGVHNAFMDAMAAVDEIAPYPYQHWLTRDIRNAAAAQGRAEYLSLWAGQAVGLARPLPAAAIVAALTAGAGAAAEAARAALLGSGTGNRV
jgi:nitronate monooxygenase